MKTVCSLAAMTAMLSSAFAGSTISVPAPDGVGDVVALTNALWSAAQGDEIVLAKGEYDLSSLATAEGVMVAGNSTSQSQVGAILQLKKSSMILRGATGDPRDVVLKVVDNPGYRILATTDSSQIRDLTMTGGKTISANCGAWNFRGGAAISMQSSGVVISNCVFHGNTSQRHGGAVSGLNGRYGTVIDCVFYGNNGSAPDGDAGIAGGYSTFENCVFTNNVTTAGTSAYNRGVVFSSILRNCLIKDNDCCNGALLSCAATDCRIINNYARSTDYNNGWGGGAKNSSCTNCVFIGNSANRFGGAGSGGNFVNCTIISNAVRYANYDGGGGGVCKAANVIGCTIVSNTASYATGGGVCDCTFVSNCVIRYNCARKGSDPSNPPGGYPNNGGGGGAARSACFDCEFVGNVANFGLGGGALYAGSASNCTFRDHATQSFRDVTNLVDCVMEASGGFINVTEMSNCRVHNCDNRTNVVRAVNNVEFPEGITNKSYMYMFEKAHLVRGCLFENNVQSILSGSSVNTAMFNGGATGRVENCTIADNVNYHLIRNFNGSYPIEFVNCALVRNRTGVNETGYRDTDGLDFQTSNLVFRSCAFTRKTSGTNDANCVTISDPKFVREGDHPYSPKPASPLVKNKGVVLDWMADAKDLAGNPRLRDGMVDIGCYQCWLNPLGMLLLFR